MTQTERIANEVCERHLGNWTEAHQAELEDQARYLESYPNAHILGLGPNHSRKPWSRWALDLTSLGGAAVLVALIFWAWLAWMEAQ